MDFDFSRDADRKFDPLVWNTDDLHALGKIVGIFIKFREYDITDKDTGEVKTVRSPVLCVEKDEGKGNYVYVSLPSHFSLLAKLKDVKIGSAVEIEIGKDKVGSGINAFFPYVVSILKPDAFKMPNDLKKFLSL